jgi:hypothetical protein
MFVDGISDWIYTLKTLTGLFLYNLTTAIGKTKWQRTPQNQEPQKVKARITSLLVELHRNQIT